LEKWLKYLNKEHPAGKGESVGFNQDSLASAVNEKRVQHTEDKKKIK
jgi:hypothetical protein